MYIQYDIFLSYLPLPHVIFLNRPLLLRIRPPGREGLPAFFHSLFSHKIRNEEVVCRRRKKEGFFYKGREALVPKRPRRDFLLSFLTLYSRLHTDGGEAPRFALPEKEVDLIYFHLDEKDFFCYV